MANLGLFSMSVKDYSKETSNFRLNIPLVDDSNIVAVNGQLATLRLATEAIELGNTVKDLRSWVNIALDPTPPTDKAAQRESKWLVSYIDTVTFDVYRCEIPCADSSLLIGQSDTINAVNFTGVVDTFRDAFEAVIVSKNGNAVTVQSLQFVGKRL